MRNPAIEAKMREVLANGSPFESGLFVKTIVEVLGVDKWDVRAELWRLTAAGWLEFTPGFAAVFLRKEQDCSTYNGD